MRVPRPLNLSRELTGAGDAVGLRAGALPRHAGAPQRKVMHDRHWFLGPGRSVRWPRRAGSVWSSGERRRTAMAEAGIAELFGKAQSSLVARAKEDRQSSASEGPHASPGVLPGGAGGPLGLDLIGMSASGTLGALRATACISEKSPSVARLFTAYSEHGKTYEG